MTIKATLIKGAMLLLLVGCRLSTKHEVEVKPMHITIDVNIRVDRALDDFFADIDRQAQKTDAPAQ